MREELYQEQVKELQVKVLELTAERDRLKEENASLKTFLSAAFQELEETRKRLEAELVKKEEEYQRMCAWNNDLMTTAIKRDAELAEARKLLQIVGHGFHLLAHPSERDFDGCMWETCGEVRAFLSLHATAKEVG